MGDFSPRFNRTRFEAAPTLAVAFEGRNWYGQFVKEKRDVGSAGHYSSILKTEIGELMLVADETSLVGLYFLGGKHVPERSAHWQAGEGHGVIRQAVSELSEYFKGERKSFSVPVRMVGTPFQHRVWKEIARIPFGKTLTYSELAERAGHPGAVRAAGSSTGRNPLSIIVPCHRVMGKNGSLTGFAGGLERKARLLEFEKCR